jgi:hypothetical protein
MKTYNYILCWFGFHIWGYGYSNDSGIWESCDRPECNKTRKMVWKRTRSRLKWKK